MSAQFIRKTAQASAEPANESAPEVVPMDAAEKAVWDKVLGDNQSEELTADTLKVATDASRGVYPEVVAEPKKAGGDVAAEPDSVTQKTAEEVAAEEAAAAEEAERVAAEEEANKGKTEEELAAEKAKANEGKTAEEIAAEEQEAERIKAEEAEAARVAAEEEELKDKSRVRINRANFDSDEDYKVAVKTTALMNEFGLSPTQAEVKARELLNLKPKAATAAPATIADDSDEAVALKTAEKEYEDAEAALDVATDAYDADAMKAARKASREAQAKVYEAKEAVKSAKAAAAVYQESIAAAVDKYPGSDDPTSRMGKEVAAVFNSKPANDPFWKNPNRAMIAADEAAANLTKDGFKVTTKTTAATSPSATPAKPATTKQPKVSPVPGKARTLTPTATPAAAADAELAKALGKNAHMLAAMHS